MKHHFLLSLTICFFVYSKSVLALSIEGVGDIYNIDINDLCRVNHKSIKDPDSPALEQGCINSKGEKHGIWIKQYKDIYLEVNEYQNGNLKEVIFGAHPKAEDVSIINLIATPDKYVGKRVRITGYYFNPHFEINGISMNHIDHKFSSSKNAIWVNLPKYLRTEKIKQKVNNKYVYLEGIFTKFKGHMGQYSGTIEQVNRIEARDAMNKMLEKSCK